MLNFSRLAGALAEGHQEHQDSMPLERIKAEHGRFKIWSGSLGALQTGHSSLDFRLRQSNVMQMNITKLLERLEMTLQKSRGMLITWTSLSNRSSKPVNGVLAIFQAD
jgi:hypothetical protein